MDKDVMIYINGMQYVDLGGQGEPVEVIAPGKYYFRNGSHYLLFDDIGDFSNEWSRSTIKFRKAYLEVRRRGDINTQLVFEENKKTKSLYGTPFGQLNIGISATLIDFKEQEDKIELTANYALEINDTFVSDCSISLIAKPRKSDFSLTS